MNPAKKVLHVWNNVFRNRKYVLLSFVIAFVFYFVNTVILNFTSFYFQWDFVYLLRFVAESLFGFFSIVNLFTSVGTILLSVFIGMLASLMIYRFSIVGGGPRMERAGFIGSLGVLLGAAAPGCAACGVGLLSFLGFSSILTVLPFKGDEILIAALMLTGFSVYSISGKLYNPVCEVTLMSKTERDSHSKSFSFIHAQKTERRKKK